MTEEKRVKLTFEQVETLKTVLRDLETAPSSEAQANQEGQNSVELEQIPA
ncbi:MAG: hypothetical protein JRN20_14050 [Nitrososphaerota archaeon]|nr:hypothetical protein [Nitrososphaerota archaeon]MDG6923887.1 hypothetical protein [Nitrososphaerota archaeon]